MCFMSIHSIYGSSPPEMTLILVLQEFRADCQVENVRTTILVENLTHKS